MTSMTVQPLSTMLSFHLLRRVLHRDPAEKAARLLRCHVAARGRKDLLAGGTQKRDVTHDDLPGNGEFLRQRRGADGRVRRAQHIGNGFSPLVRMHASFPLFSPKQGKFRFRSG